MAKIGAAKKHIDYQCKLATNVIKTAKKEWLQKAFERYWEYAPRMKHSKALMVYPNKYRTRKLVKMKKLRIRIWTMFLTGHGIFKKHLKTIGLISESNCRFCKENVEETAVHLLGYCIVFEYERIILFEKEKLR